MDFGEDVGQVHREVDSADGKMRVKLRRMHDEAIASLWGALTDPERLRRWFMPVRGDLREGGTFELQDETKGKILTCTKQERLRIVLGGEDSVVELRLTEVDAELTLLELEHTVPADLSGVQGALQVGSAWDGTLLGLSLYLDGTLGEDPAAAANSIDTQEYFVDAIGVWTELMLRAELAPTEEIATAAAATLDRFAPDVER